MPQAKWSCNLKHSAVAMRSLRSVLCAMPLYVNIRGKRFSTIVEADWEKRENHFHFLKEVGEEEI
jgi:hypothetical protein